MQRERKREPVSHTAQEFGGGAGAGSMGQAGWSSEGLATLRHLQSLCDDQGPRAQWLGKDKCSEHLRVKGPTRGHQHTSSRDAFTVKPATTRPWKNHRSVGKS